MEVRLSPHDEARVEEIRSTHRRNGRVCGCCGQSWPCTEVAWADGRTEEPAIPWTLADRARVAAAAVICVGVDLGLSQVVPAPTSVVLLILLPVVLAVVLILMAKRRPLTRRLGTLARWLILVAALAVIGASFLWLVAGPLGVQGP